MKQFKDTIELIWYIQRNMEANPWIPFDAFLMEMWNRWDTIDWAPIQDIVNWRNWWYEDVKAKCEWASNSVDLSWHDEAIFSTEEPEPEMEEDKKTIYNSRNYDALKDFVEKYNALVKQKEEKLSEYNNFKWYNEKTWVIDKGKQEIEDINTQLKEMEDWDEFKEILQSIKDYWLWDKFYEDDSWLRAWVDNIMNKRWSAIEKNNALKKFFLWSNMVSNTQKNMNDLIDDYLWWKSNTKKEKQLNPEFVEKNKDNEKLWPNFREKLKEQSNNNKKNKWWMSSIAEETFTDSMKFWDDAAAIGWWYVDKRNNTLSMHLKERWLDTPEKIDQYLSKYPSWKNAKQEWKDNTLVNLTGMVKELNNKNIKNKWEDKNEIKEEVKSNKKEIKKEDKNNKDVKLWKPGSNWLPDMDSSINWVEEEKDDTLIYDKKWNPVWSKANIKDIKAEKKEEKKNDNKKIKIKDIKKAIQKDPNVQKVVQNSKVIQWLLNIKKSK